MSEQSCSFRGPLGWHFATLPLCCSCLSSMCPGHLGTLPSWFKGLGGGTGMNLAPRGTETRVPAWPRSLCPQGVRSFGAGAGGHCRTRWLNAVFFKE